MGRNDDRQSAVGRHLLKVVSGWLRGQSLALLFGLAVATGPGRAYSQPDDSPPEGFVRQDLKEIRASILRPEKWLFRQIIPAAPFYNLSPQPFDSQYGVTKGVAIHVMTKTDKSADEMAAGWVAQCAEQHKVLRGWTRKATPAEPFTVYGLVCLLGGEETGGEACTCEAVLIANHVTNTVYQCWLAAPTAEWKDIEQTGETMLANLRLDPKF